MHRPSPVERKIEGGGRKHKPTGGKFRRPSLKLSLLLHAAACSVPVRPSEGAFVPAVPRRRGVFAHPAAGPAAAPRSAPLFPDLRRGSARSGPTLSAGGDDGDNTEPEQDDAGGPVSPVKKGLDTFVGWSYRCGLFLTPFLSNPRIRDRVGPYFRPELLLLTALGLASLSVSYSTYERRYYDLGDAADRRLAALSVLREIQVAKLSRAVPDDEKERAVAEYGEALRAELSLRVVVPGLFRMDEFSDPVGNEEDEMAAGRYLGLRFDGNGELVRIEND